MHVYIGQKYLALMSSKCTVFQVAISYLDSLWCLFNKCLSSCHSSILPRIDAAQQITVLSTDSPTWVMDIRSSSIATTNTYTNILASEVCKTSSVIDTFYVLCVVMLKKHPCFITLLFLEVPIYCIHKRQTLHALSKKFTFFSVKHLEAKLWCPPVSVFIELAEWQISYTMDPCKSLELWRNLVQIFRVCRG